MRILPPLRDQVGDALMRLKDQNGDLKWMEDRAFVALAVKALEEHLVRRKSNPPMEA